VAPRMLRSSFRHRNCVPDDERRAQPSVGHSAGPPKRGILCVLAARLSRSHVVAGLVRCHALADWADD
jgi:hypothetical protein